MANMRELTQRMHLESNRSIARAALTALLVAILPGAANAYNVRLTDSGQIVRWQSERVELRLDSSLAALGDEDAVHRAIIEAIDTWQESGLLPPDLSIISTDDAEHGFELGGRNTNDIIAITGDWPYSEHYAAVTITTYDSYTGALIDADIVFNANRDWSVGGNPEPYQQDLLDVATHEVGHLIGLEHSENSEATMYAEGPRGSTARRTLHFDDLDALTAAYGPPPALGRESAAGCALASSNTSRAPIAELLLLLVVSGLRRRK